MTEWKWGHSTLLPESPAPLPRSEDVSLTVCLPEKWHAGVGEAGEPAVESGPAGRREWLPVRADG